MMDEIQVAKKVEQRDMNKVASMAEKKAVWTVFWTAVMKAEIKVAKRVEQRERNEVEMMDEKKA